MTHHNPLAARAYFELTAGTRTVTTQPSNVNHPSHYTKHPSGVECIQITEHMSFLLGNVVKYVWRAGEKGEALEDLEKAAWYLAREIARLKHDASASVTPTNTNSEA